MSSGDPNSTIPAGSGDGSARSGRDHAAHGAEEPPIDRSASCDPIVGIDLGGTNMTAGVVDDRGEVHGRSRAKTEASGGSDTVYARLVACVDEACREAGLRRDQLSAVGIGAPGAVDPHQGIVLEATNLFWKDEPLAARLSDRLGVRVAVDNDVNCALYAEFRLGAGRGVKDLLGVWVGTGLGGALILGGRPYYGHFLTAGEIGRGIVLPWAPPGQGSLEQICSRQGIVENVLRLLRTQSDCVLPELVADLEGGLERIGTRELAQAFQMGDELVVSVIDHAAEVLGVAVGGMVTLLSLGRVVIGGGVTEGFGEPWIQRVRRAVRRSAFPDRCKSVEVVMTELRVNAGTVGAALIARERLLGRTAPAAGG